MVTTARLFAGPRRPGGLAARPAKAARGRPRWWRALGYWTFRWRRTFRSTVTGNFVYPVLYLAAIGVGLGGLIDHHGGGRGIEGVGYLAFVAPGLLAGSAMQLALHESTYPVLGAIRWERSYEAMLATPLSVLDVLAGHLGFVVLRVLTGAAVFVAVAFGFGALVSPEAILAIPAAVLTGTAFSGPLVAWSVTRQDDSSFSAIQRLVVVPLFLFSGSFFPIAILPGFLQPLAEATPLYHGVALCRAATLGRLWQPTSLAHLAYLVALSLAGYLVARVTYRRRLAP